MIVDANTNLSVLSAEEFKEAQDVLKRFPLKFSDDEQNRYCDICLQAINHGRSSNSKTYQAVASVADDKGLFPKLSVIVPTVKFTSYGTRYLDPIIPEGCKCPHHSNLKPCAKGVAVFQDHSSLGEITTPTNSLEKKVDRLEKMFCALMSKLSNNLLEATND